ncbi:MULTISPECIES: hypothetical protein [Candidatus Ichthyocystis]|uniref:hypothetical protein n=1 Tax=Candidatus Ichthyocystis TaxID=2929841 RepID=UPI000B89D45F|nr:MULTISPECIES: hypothetical protein [Ichthyocystis]
MDIFFFLLSVLCIALFEKHSKFFIFAGSVSIVASRLLVSHESLGNIFLPITSNITFLIDLFFILTTFSFVSEHIERSRITLVIKRIIPRNAMGYFCLLLITFLLSTFLDNILAALVCGTVAQKIIGNISVQFIAAIVAAANAGGAGSALGDTTTTMLWLSGVPATKLIYAFYGSVIALFLFGIPASLNQYKKTKIENCQGMSSNNETHLPVDKTHLPVDKTRLLLVAFLLLMLIVTNSIKNRYTDTQLIKDYPITGIFMLFMCFLTAITRNIPRKNIIGNMSGHIILLGLIVNAHLINISSLPTPSALSTLIIGIVSACIDNIPLTAMAIEQKGYNWPLLAFSVGFGGSLLWFGSSAGIILTHHLKKGRTIREWLSLPLILSFVVGFYLIHIAV